MPNVALLYSRTSKTLFPKAENVDPQAKILLAILVTDAFSHLSNVFGSNTQGEEVPALQKQPLLLRGKVYSCCSVPLAIDRSRGGKDRATLHHTIHVSGPQGPRWPIDREKMSLWRPQLSHVRLTGHACFWQQTDPTLPLCCRGTYLFSTIHPPTTLVPHAN